METQAVVTMVMKKGHGLRPLSLFDFSTQDLPLCPLDASASVAQKLRSVLLDLPEYRLSYTLTNFLFFPPTNSFLLFLPSNPPPFHLYIFFLDSSIELHFYQQNRYALFQRIKRKKKKHCQYQLNNSRTTEDTLTHISRAPPPCFRSTPPSLPVTFDE